jgi:integrase/recombinase XerD
MRVNLTKRVKTSNGFKFCPVVMTATGRVEPDIVFVGGLPEYHPEGTYYLDWYEKEGKKRTRRRKVVGRNATIANNMRMWKQLELQEDAHKFEKPVDEAMLAYIEEARLLGKRPAYVSALKTALHNLKDFTSKQSLHEITRDDLLRFASYLRDEKHLSPKVCWNQMTAVVGFLKANGIKGLITKNDWPPYTENTLEEKDNESTDLPLS